MEGGHRVGMRAGFSVLVPLLVLIDLGKPHLAPYACFGGLHLALRTQPAPPDPVADAALGRRHPHPAGFSCLVGVAGVAWGPETLREAWRRSGWLQLQFVHN